MGVAPDGAAIAPVASADPAGSHMAISVSVADVLDAAALRVNGQAVPHRETRLVTLAPEPRPADRSPQRRSKGAVDVQGSQQTSRRRARGRGLYRARQQVGQSVSDRSRRRSRSSDSKIRALACGSASALARTGRVAGAAISSASARRGRATAICCCGSPIRRAMRGSRGGGASRLPLEGPPRPLALRMK